MALSLDLIANQEPPVTVGTKGNITVHFRGLLDADEQLIDSPNPPTVKELDNNGVVTLTGDLTITAPTINSAVIENHLGEDIGIKRAVQATVSGFLLNVSSTEGTYYLEIECETDKSQKRTMWVKIPVVPAPKSGTTTTTTAAP